MRKKRNNPEKVKCKKPLYFYSGFVNQAWRCPTLTWGDPTLPSALLRFTSEFGMESGGSKVLWSPNKFCDVSFKLSIKIDGADTQNRTGDLILTKDALYRLSHISTQKFKTRYK